MSLDRPTLSRISAKLQGMLDELEAEVATTVDGMRVGTGAFPDPTDRASLESDRNLTLRIRDRERKLRNKIEDALARIEEGTFGTCEGCECVIPERRLDAVPYARYCVECQSKAEAGLPRADLVMFRRPLRYVGSPYATALTETPDTRAEKSPLSVIPGARAVDSWFESTGGFYYLWTGPGF